MLNVCINYIMDSKCERLNVKQDFVRKRSIITKNTLANTGCNILTVFPKYNLEMFLKIARHTSRLFVGAHFRKCMVQ